MRSFTMGNKVRGAAAMTLLFVLSGCANPAQTKQTLDGGYAALRAGQLDEAMTAADQVLQSTPNGPGTAEARYLRGRVLEGRAIASPGESPRYLQQARAEYEAALAAKPLPPDVEADVHAGIANVAYHQDDYGTALSEYRLAADKLPKEEDKVSVVYRMGQSAQRLGRWDEADKYFGIVQEMAPNQPVAHEARLRQGARAFAVQLATLNDAKAAGAVVAQLRKQSVAATSMPDATTPKLTVIRVGPLATYADARAMKSRFAEQYPNAIILP